MRSLSHRLHSVLFYKAKLDIFQTLKCMSSYELNNKKLLEVPLKQLISNNLQTKN
ncbi:Uncharacterised protein [Capnocytophaga granulosa]|nr:Uncharacterised protein [Capnocytophaga granulosa]